MYAGERLRNETSLLVEMRGGQCRMATLPRIRLSAVFGMFDSRKTFGRRARAKTTTGAGRGGEGGRGNHGGHGEKSCLERGLLRFL